MTIHVSPSLSRRHFLRGTTALGVATAIAPPSFVNFARAQPARSIADANWSKFAGELVGPLLRPNDSPFQRFAAPYNLAYADLLPAGIAVCATPEDVAASIKWARENEVPLTARGGGHSYAGYSTTKGLMIDVSAMRAYHWDAPGRRVTFAAGARNEDLYGILAKANRTMTHGRCPTVGAAGFLLGGGIGFNMRLYGVASDHLVASEIVTANGDILKLSEHENADLFWACRGGGGGNFGINTSFTVDVFETSPVTVFKASWTGTAAQMAKVGYLLMDRLTDAPHGFGSRFAITAPNPRGCVQQFGANIIGQFRGAIDRTALIEDMLAPALHAAGKPQKVDKIPPPVCGPSPQEPTCFYTIQYTRSYWDAQTKFLIDTDKPFAFHERSAFLASKLTQGDFERAVEFLAGWKGTNDVDPKSPDQPLNADFRFFQTGGAMNTMGASKTAFFHRGSRWLMDIGLPFTAADPAELVQANVDWQNRFYDAMRPASTGFAYQNFIDPALNDPMHAYYGYNIGKLREVKTRYDRDNVFKFAQSIPPAPRK